jgi:hypothetical protein
MGAKVIWNYVKGQMKWIHIYQPSQGRRSICINSIHSAPEIEVSLATCGFKTV